jgi:phosphate starvation-inducible protein PhoH
MTDADVHIPVQSVEEARTLLGPLDSNARLIRELHGVSVLARDGSVRLLGDAARVQVVQQVIEDCLATMRAGRKIGTQDVASRLRSTLGIESALDVPSERPLRAPSSGRSASSVTSTASTSTTWCSRSDPPAPARPTSRSPRRSRR